MKERSTGQHNVKKHPHHKHTLIIPNKTLILGATAIGLGVLGAAGYYINSQTSLPATCPAIDGTKSEPELQNDNLQTVLKKAKDLNIKPNPEEQEMWYNAYKSFKEMPESQKTIQAAIKRVDLIKKSMRISANDKFKTADRDISALDTQGKIMISIVEDLSPDKKTTMDAIPYLEGQEVKYGLIVVYGYVLNSNPLDVAFDFVHMSFVLKSLIDHEKDLPKSLTSKQKLDAINAYLLDPKAFVGSEITAEAEVAQAVTGQYKIGLKGEITPEHLKTAADYIKTGYKPEAQGWRDCIVTEYSKMN